MKADSIKYIALLFFFSSACLFPQKSDEPRIIVDSNFDIRKIAEQYLGSSDLWPHILRFNNIKNLSEIRIGGSIIIPQKKVRDLLENLDKTNKSIQAAVVMGAKVLANETLEKAIELYQQALQQKDNFEYESAGKSCYSSISYAHEAYQKTREIREKTIDAVISFKKGTVQKMFPSLLKWQEAALYENLQENDWARTLAFSLADITFYDLNQIKLNENSQAVIQSSRYDVLGNRTTTKVRLEKGDAYAKLLNSPKKKFDLDIPGIKTRIDSKYFWVEKNEGNTKLSNYNGEIALQVKDSSVVVQKNQGSVVPKGGFPSKPKSLLSAPQLRFPENFSRIPDTKSAFSWMKVKNAVGYWIEIASDADFKKINSSIKNIKELSVESAGFTNGVYYWHICSMDTLGLPGPYSEFRTFIVALDKNKPFLDIQNPDDNSVSTENKLQVKGITDPDCLVKIGDASLRADSAGLFQNEISLAFGKNEITIQSIGKNGIISKNSRVVYYDPGPDIKISDSVLGNLEANKKIYTGNPVLTFHLSTRPLSRIEIRPVGSESPILTYSDTLGNCEVNIRTSKPAESYSLTVISMAGFKKVIPFEILKTSKLPVIILDPSLEQTAAGNEYVVKGTVSGAKELFVNDEKTFFSSNGGFVSKQHLNSPINIIIVKAAGPDGSIASIEKKVVFDNHPPKLISHELKSFDEKKSLYKITVKAEDETSLKRSALAEVRFGDISKEVILEYNPDKELYEAVFKSEGKEKPVIRSIVLEDQLLNRKTYLISK